ncbi:elp4p [Saccharomyces arboricola H-6]|uniref:Elongator complex protein 4 n=1 Tax=Saccharomyces arboricola (strain H-6 / AS 2.3317 / CBS 10644) TaxID=1160507 RepID=J8LHA8_SACAR|nr:elp4p [Saccharomyces arboricola H-6]
MSFRKRGEVLNDRGSGPRSPLVRGAPRNSSISLKTPNRRIPGDVSLSETTAKLTKLKILDEARKTHGLESTHVGIRPSPATSQPTTSTGSADLDNILGHMGLPLGNSLLVEEQSTTEFHSILAKLFAAQGIVHNRISDGTTDKTRNGDTHVIVLSLNEMFAKELPGIYKGSRKQMKKNLISEEESKVTVQNLNQTQRSTPSRYNDLKIAWKYKLADEKKLGSPDREDMQQSSEYKDYNHHFEITSRLLPAPIASELTFIAPTQPISTILGQMEQVIKKNDTKLIRIIIPSLLHPAMYPPKMFASSEIIGLLHGVRSLVKKYDERVVLFASTSVDIITPPLLVQLTNMFDSVIDLEPFNQEMSQFLERVYKSQPGKIQHGLVHILKLPVFTDRGEMRVLKSEWAFRNGRKRFEIEEWGIPVDDTEASSNSEQSHSHSHSHPDSPNEVSHNKPAKKTKISLEF